MPEGALMHSYLLQSQEPSSETEANTEQSQRHARHELRQWYEMWDMHGYITA